MKPDLIDMLMASNLPPQVSVDYTKMVLWILAKRSGLNRDADVDAAIDFATGMVTNLGRKYLSDSPTDDDYRKVLIHLIENCLAILKGTMKVEIPQS